MLRIVFEGGLGNQVFEFVMGKYLQKYFNDEIEYDVSKYPQIRNYAPNMIQKRK